MFMDTPETLIFVAAGAFLLGWLVGKIGAYIGSRVSARKRDPRDDRIRNLDAELRIAQTNVETSGERLEGLAAELEEKQEHADRADSVIVQQQQKIDKLRRDLKESVLKTRELRADLANRATENVKSEVKLREVETELSVAHASTDMIATGVLDYSLAPDSPTENSQEGAPKVNKTAS